MSSYQKGLETGNNGRCLSKLKNRTVRYDILDDSRLNILYCNAEKYSFIFKVGAGKPISAIIATTTLDSISEEVYQYPKVSSHL
jgi:hypothetical protein